jgi:hypothetical protein
MPYSPYRTVTNMSLIYQIEPFKSCPRYAKCSVNRCPLQTIYPEGFTAKTDKDKKCGLAKTIRQRVSGEFPGFLKLGGLTAREAESARRWAALTDEQRTEQINRIKLYSGNREAIAT